MHSVRGSLCCVRLTLELWPYYSITHSNTIMTIHQQQQIISVADTGTARGQFLKGRLVCTLFHPPAPSASSLFLLLFVSCSSLCPPPSPNHAHSTHTHTHWVLFPAKSPLQHSFQCAQRSQFLRSARDGIAIKSHVCRSVGARMKRFMTIVLRGLVSLSKENPIWAKEHHRPPKKEIRRKRRAVKRPRNMGRRNLVKAVGISPVVS